MVSSVTLYCQVILQLSGVEGLNVFVFIFDIVFVFC